MNDILNILTSLSGLNADSTLLALGILVAVCNILGRVIPDSATGPLAILRKVAKVVGLYVSNRVTPAITVNTVSKAVAASATDDSIRSAANSLPEAIATGTSAGEFAREMLDSAQGKTPGRPFVEGESPADDSIVPNEYRTDGPFAAQRNK